MNKGIVTIIIFLLIILIGIGAAIIFIFGLPKLQGDTGNGYVHSTGEKFLTNIRSGGQFIKADIQIEVEDKKSLKFVEKNNHKIRDQIIEVLGNIEEEDINKENFLRNLKENIKEELQTGLKTDKIKAVYFDEIIIQ